MLLPNRRTIAFLCILAPACGGYAADSVQGDFLVHAVKPGDTLMSLCQEYCRQPTDWPALLQFNYVAFPWFIPVYRDVFIPLKLLKRQPETLEVTVVQGGARANEAPVTTASRLPAGTRIVTERDGYVTLRLEDGSTLTLQAASEAEIESAERLMGTNVRNTRIRLRSGRVESRVSKDRHPASEFFIQTPVAKTAVRGTAYRVASDETSRGEVLSGSIAVSSEALPESAAITVNGGYGTMVSATEPPLPPRPLLPAPDLSRTKSLLTADRTTLIFPPVPEAKAYRVQIALDDDFRQIVADGVFRDTQAFFKPLPEGEYPYRVRAIDDIGLEGFDAVSRLKLRPVPPALPKTIEPSDGAEFPSGKLTLRWTGEAPRYRLQIAQDPGFRQLVQDHADIAGNSHALQLENKPGRYYWRVAGYSRAGELGKFSQPKHFSVQPPPSPPVAVVPSDGAEFPSGKLTLRWTGEAPRYRLQIAQDPGFRQLVQDHADIAGNSHALQLENKPGRYYWRVAGYLKLGEMGAFNEPRQLFVRPLPPPVTVTAISETSLNFAWEAKPGERYEFQLAREPEFIALLFEATTENGSLSVPRPEPGEYYYRLRQVASDGESGPYSPPASVSVPDDPRPWWLLLLLLAIPFL